MVVHYYENFESQPLGSFPSGWESGISSGCDAQISDSYLPGGGNRCLKCRINTGMGPGLVEWIRKPLNNISPLRNTSFSFWFRPVSAGGTASWFKFTVVFSDGSELGVKATVTNTSGPSGKFKAVSPGGLEWDLITYSGSSGHNIDIRHDPSTGNWKAFIDGSDYGPIASYQAYVTYFKVSYGCENHYFEIRIGGISIVESEGTAQALNFSYPGQARFNQNFNFSFDLKNISSYYDQLYYILRDSDYGNILGQNRREISPNQSFRYTVPIVMPDRNLNLSLEVGHEEV